MGWEYYFIHYYDFDSYFSYMIRVKKLLRFYVCVHLYNFFYIFIA